MRAPRPAWTSALLVPVLLLSGCGLLNHNDVVPPTRPSAAATSAGAASGTAGSASAIPTSSATAAASDAALARFYDQKVTWHNCGTADCATLIAPLDYADPAGATINLAITRMPATGKRIGSLFVDPGGPGGSAVDYAKAADYIVSPSIREHYDIVGMDPRGVGKSTPVDCMTDAEADRLAAVDATPDSPAEQQDLLTTSRLPADGCASRSPDVYAHVGTVDAARDLDIARAVVNDDTLNYLGKSYGTMLGATYAELFPDHVGRMVLDGVLPANLDLVAVTKGQADSFELQLRDFVRDCLTQKDCPLHGTVDQGVQQVRDFINGLDATPLHGTDRDLNESLGAFAILSNLYFPSYDYPRLRTALTAAMRNGDPSKLLAMLDDRTDRGPNGHYTTNSGDAFYAISCLDRPFSGTVDDVVRYAQEWKATSPTFGPALAWGLMTCKDWPATTSTVTSTVAKGSNPILVVSTKQDPATPYAWGVQVAHELANGHLVTYEGTGHTAYGEGSSCVDTAVDEYLLRGTVPSTDPDCH